MDDKASFTIEVINGVYDGMRLSFSNFPVTIGRSPDNDVSIPFDTAASRAHAKIVKGESRHSLFIVDLNSTNGTFINGILVKDQAEIRSNDEIKIGDTLFRCSVNI